MILSCVCGGGGGGSYIKHRLGGLDMFPEQKFTLVLQDCAI